jgi:hypothetical protein
MSTLNANTNVSTNVVTEKKEVIKPTFKKVTSEKDLKAKKDLAIQRSKESIKNPTSKKVLSSEQILNLDFENLDLKNLQSLIKDNIKTKSISTKEKMYKFERESLTKEQIKKERSRIRKERTKFCSNILDYFKNNLNDKLKVEIKKFNDFYKKTYLLNDLSIGSIAQSNSDKETLVNLNLMLQIVKKFK